RAHWGIADDAPVVGAVLGPQEKRELELLLETFGELRRLEPRAELLVSGWRDEGQGWRGLGPFTDSPAFYLAIDVLCIPRARRVVPLNLLEALAAGVPIAAGRPASEAGRAPEGPWAFASLCEDRATELARNLRELLSDRESARALV